MQTTLFCVGILLLLQPALSLALGGSDEDGGMTRTRRGWSMMRLGRGLQMLRLGKRLAPPPAAAAPALPAVADPREGSFSDLPSSPEEMRALLSGLVDEARQDFRRQPPMPRYGRDLARDSLDEEDLFSLLGDAYYRYPVSSSSSPSSGVYRHMGRFKRSIVGGGSSRFMQQRRGMSSSPSSSSFSSSDLDRSLQQASRIRALALPRIGRYLGGRAVYKLRPAKAVPAPRIGRQVPVAAAADRVVDRSGSFSSSSSSKGVPASPSAPAATTTGRLGRRAAVEGLV